MRDSFVQPDCRYYHRKPRSALRLRSGLNGAAELDCALTGTPARIPSEVVGCHESSLLDNDLRCGSVTIAVIRNENNFA